MNNDTTNTINFPADATPADITVPHPIEGEQWYLVDARHNLHISTCKRAYITARVMACGTIKPARFVAVSKQQGGYEFCQMDTPEYGHENLYIHRLMYEAFVGEIPEGFHVDHSDSDNKNHDADNLQALSPEAHRKITAERRAAKRDNCPECRPGAEDGELCMYHNINTHVIEREFGKAG